MLPLTSNSGAHLSNFWLSDIVHINDDTLFRKSHDTESFSLRILRAYIRWEGFTHLDKA